MSKNQINVTSYIDYSKAEANRFTSASKAVAFIHSELSKVSDEELFSKAFSWVGDACCVPASVLNTVLRSLEATGNHFNIFIIPSLTGGPGRHAEYFIVPYLFNPEYPIKLGVAFTSEI